jgi:hypothetical protein
MGCLHGTRVDFVNVHIASDTQKRKGGMGNGHERGRVVQKVWRGACEGTWKGFTPYKKAVGCSSSIASNFDISTERFGEDKINAKRQVEEASSQ